MIQSNVIPKLPSGYNIEQSLRFNDNDSAYLSRTPSVAGNRKTWTFSTWFKRGNLGTWQTLISAGNVSYFDEIRIASDDTLWVNINNGNDAQLKTTQVFRDVSSSYFIEVIFDTTQTISSDRIKIKINGSEVTSFSLANYPTLNYECLYMNNTYEHNIGRLITGTQFYLDGYLAETHFIDGQSLTPDNFGEFDATYGHWKPKKYNGTYGTNGFYLPFDDAGFIGKDNSTTLGSELVTNGTFDSDLSGWTDGSTSIATWVDGVLKYERNGSSVSNFYQALSVENGKTYTISMDILSISSSSLAGRLYVGSTANGAEVTSISYNANEIGQKYVTFTASYTGLLYLNIFYSGLTTGYMVVDNISVREIITQGNDFTANNLSATDIVLDSPTNNFATLNVLSGLTATLAEGNLKLNSTANAWHWRESTQAVKSGKWYFECYAPSSTNDAIVAIIKQGLSAFSGATMDLCGIYSSHINNQVRIYANGSIVQGYDSTINWRSNGTILGVAIDNDNGSIDYYYNGTLEKTQTHSITSDFIVAILNYGSGTTTFINFGQDSSFAGNKTSQGYTDANGIGDFYYQPPEGYLALCTKNLPEPTVVPSENFDVVTYAGLNSSQTINTSLDSIGLSWLKTRNYMVSHGLIDIVRPNGYRLEPDSTSEEVDSSDKVLLNGGSINLALGDIAWSNRSGYNHVAWNWKAGGTPVVNNDGTIQSLVSANIDAGFSIVGWNSTTSYSDTVGHGLSKAPDIVIYKQRSSASNWTVTTTLIDGSNDYMLLNATNAKADSPNSSPTSSVITSSYASVQSCIAYCFHSVEGYSKIDAYIGNGSADGPFVYCGFRPKYVMIKNATTSATNWFIYDSEIGIYNQINNALLANTSNAEVSPYGIDFVSNGFKVRVNNSNTNTSGNTYLFYAIAETPFKYSNSK